MAKLQDFPRGFVLPKPEPEPVRLSQADLVQFSAINHTLRLARAAYDAALAQEQEADAALCTALVAKQAIDAHLIHTYGLDPRTEMVGEDGTICPLPLTADPVTAES